MNDGDIPSKTDIIESYWLEFLRWVKKFNEGVVAENKESASRGVVYYEKDATEINFWHWYIEHKL